MTQRSLHIETETNGSSLLLPEDVGRILTGMCPIIVDAVCMVFRGRSRLSGRHPQWLQRVGNIRFMGAEVNGHTSLHFEAPTLGEAAAELYEQKEFWDSRPSEEDTGFEVLTRVVDDIDNSNPDSQLYDDKLLSRFTNLHKIFRKSVKKITVVGEGCNTQKNNNIGSLDLNTVKQAKELLSTTPTPQQIVLVGRLDMIRVSTRTFELELSDKTRVRGVWDERLPVDRVKTFLNSDVMISGIAIYRPSGHLLRIDVESVEKADAVSSVFSHLPPVPGTTLQPQRLVKKQTKRSGVPAFLGAWPGDETDEEWATLIEQVS